MNPIQTLSLTIWSLLTASAFSNGFYIPVQSPEATAKGNAWLATADTASAVYYNAAGLTQLTQPDLVVGAYAIRLGIKSETTSGTFKNDAEWSLIPQIYGATPINERLVFGYGINTPFGLATDWSAAAPFSPIAIETELNYVTGWAVLGYKLTDTLSIGGGLGLHRADASISKTPVFLGDFSSFEGNDEALSWTISARWQPTDEHAFGIVYRSQTDFNLRGDTMTLGTGQEDARLDLITPATLGVGYAYRPTPAWSFEANIEWVNWEELDTLTVSKTTGNVPLVFNWDSNLIYSFGMTRLLDNGWSVSAGYNYIENSQPDANFNPGVSDANRHWLNCGFGRSWEDVTLRFAYQYAFSDRDVTGSPFGLADGKYKSRFHGVMLNGEWKF